MKVAIVGGGVMGCSIALALAKAGVEITVLERSIPGAEASSAAAGILAPQAEAPGPGPFLDLCLRSRELYPAFVAEVQQLSGIEVGYRPSGVLHPAFDEASTRKLEARVAWQSARGLRAELLDRAQTLGLEPNLSPEVLAAAHFADDHQVDSRLLARALSMAAARVGAAFRTGHVRGLITEGSRAVGVELDGEVVRADVVVVAAGSWSGQVQGAQIDPRVVRPARGQMVRLQTRLPILSRVLFCDRGYLVPRADGSVLAGSTMELVGFDKQVTAGGLAKILAMALSLCPSLAEAPVLEHWAGLRPFTEDHLPILGWGALEGLVLATGHFRNGILLTPVTAALVAQLVLGQPSPIDLHPFRYDRWHSLSVKSPMV